MVRFVRHNERITTSGYIRLTLSAIATTSAHPRIKYGAGSERVVVRLVRHFDKLSAHYERITMSGG